MHSGNARSDVRVFFVEYWFEDREEGRLKYNNEIGAFNLTMDSPSLHGWTSGCPFDPSFAGTLEVQ